MSKQNSISTDRVLALFRTMVLIREFELAANGVNERGLMRGPLHQSLGQEAVATGVCANLKVSDLIQSNHRGHGHAIAKGTPVNAMIKEILGRQGGVNGGKGGSMHIADFSVGMMGANGILGDGMTLAVGAAQAADLKQSGQVVTVFIGDGSTNRGVFFEALNWAKVFNLPLLVVCEDNGFASSTKTGEVTAGGGPVARAKAFDIDALAVDGCDVTEVDQAAASLIQKIRSGSGPQLLYTRSYRLSGHITADKMVYRSPEEIKKDWEYDPVARCEKLLLSMGVAEEETRQIREQTRAQLEQAVAEAEQAPFTLAERAYEDILDVGGNRWK